MIGLVFLSVFSLRKEKIMDTNSKCTSKSPIIQVFSPNPQILTCGPDNDKENHSISTQHPYELPSILLTNLQSIGKLGKNDKSTELELVLDVNNIDIAVCTETWATEAVLENLEFNNYNMFHSIRNKFSRASGGLSMFIRNSICANKLNVVIPDHLEVMYISIRPKRLPRSVSNIVFCSLYYPGSNSKFAPPQEDLILHLIDTIQSFYAKFAKPLIILLGDFNDLPIEDICETCSLKQVVKVPTRKDATLDLILTNVDNMLFKDPISLPGIGKSDHFCVAYIPKDYVKPEITKKTIIIRKFKDSAKREFGLWLSTFDWSLLFEIQCVNKKVEYFFTITWLMIDKYFPTQKITISSSDREWMTIKIKDLIRQRQKAHKANNFELRDILRKKVRQEIREAKKNYNKKNAHLFHASNPREWYRHINKIMGNKNKNLNFANIPELASKAIDVQIKIVNDHFAKICKLYPPLNSNVSLNKSPNEKNLPIKSEFETYKLLNRYVKKSLGPGDFPQKILQEFTVEFTTPFCDILNCALRTNTFPDAFKKAEIIPIPKINPPRSLSDLRPISKTPIGGKIIEKVIVSELEKDIQGKLDNSQYGNCKGSSTTHYLIKLTDQAYKSTANGNATTAITIDYSKAFDYVDHNVLIEKLVQLGVRTSIIKLIISFLTGRSHNTHIFGKKSEFLNITCGVPQGTVAGPKLFVILINGDKCPFVTNLKFVDDKTLAYSYSGDPTKVLQEALDTELTGTVKDKMIINEKKCHVFTINFSKNNTAPLNLKLNDKLIESVDTIKLLGVYLTNDLKWSVNTTNICKKVNQRLYLVRKLKHFGLQKEELITAWRSILRPITEYAVPLWHSGLTEKDSYRIELLQKKALGIILGCVYVDNKRYYSLDNKIVSYDEALQKLSLTTLNQRREVLTTKFAIDTARNEKHNGFFIKKQIHNIATRNMFVIEEPFCKNERYYKSAVPYMARTLNGVFLSKKKV